jgi:hypothetical protein
MNDGNRKDAVELPVAAKWHAMRALVSDISEAAYAARWTVDTEFCVWRPVQGETARWGYAEASQFAADLAALRALAVETGLRVRHSQRPPVVVPVPLAEWDVDYQAWVARGAGA